MYKFDIGYVVGLHVVKLVKRLSWVDLFQYLEDGFFSCDNRDKYLNYCIYGVVIAIQGTATFSRSIVLLRI